MHPFGFPLIQQLQRSLWIANFVSEIVGNPAVGIDVKKCWRNAREETSWQLRNFHSATGETAAIFLRSVSEGASPE